MRWREYLRNGWSRATGGPHLRFFGRTACTIVVVLLAGCGIPEFAYLAPPIPGTVTELPPTVTFSHSVDNDTDSFFGYELYYKFYDPETGEQPFQADRTAIQNAAAGVVASTITARGYRRIQRLDSDARPTLAIPALDGAIPFTVTLRFQQEPEPEPQTPQTGAVASWTGDAKRQVALVRDQAALGNPTPPLGFTEEDIVPGVHLDLSGLEPNGLGLRMGLVIVSYGVDFATGRFGEIYSTAVVPENQLRIFY